MCKIVETLASRRILVTIQYQINRFGDQSPYISLVHRILTQNKSLDRVSLSSEGLRTDGQSGYNEYQGTFQINDRVVYYESKKRCGNVCGQEDSTEEVLNLLMQSGLRRSSKGTGGISWYQSHTRHQGIVTITKVGKPQIKTWNVINNSKVHMDEVYMHDTYIGHTYDLQRHT